MIDCSRLRTESKATTTWPAGVIMGMLPKLLRSAVRESKYYTASSDCISMQAQETRSRSSNAEANHEKLFDELQRIYTKNVPGESSSDKQAKFEATCVYHFLARLIFRCSKIADKRLVQCQEVPYG
jgi:hypothetical protein